MSAPAVVLTTAGATVEDVYRAQRALGQSGGNASSAVVVEAVRHALTE